MILNYHMANPHKKRKTINNSIAWQLETMAIYWNIKIVQRPINGIFIRTTKHYHLWKHCGWSVSSVGPTGMVPVKNHCIAAIDVDYVT